MYQQPARAISFQKNADLFSLSLSPAHTESHTHTFPVYFLESS